MLSVQLAVFSFLKNMGGVSTRRRWVALEPPLGSACQRISQTLKACLVDSLLELGGWQGVRKSFSLLTKIWL